MPKGAKRPAAATGGVAKKRATDSAVSHCAQISAALKSAALPTPTVADMLSVSTRGTLGVYKADRHPHQQSVVRMIGEVLAMIEAAKKEKLTEAETLVSNADAEKAAREKASVDAEDKYTTLCTKKQEVEDGLPAKKDAITKASDELTKAMAAQNEAAAAALSASEKQRMLQVCQRAFSDEAVTEEQSSGLFDALRELEFEDETLKYLPAILTKALETRGSFETALVKQVAGELAEKGTQIDADAAAAETKASATAEAATAAQKELDAAEQAVVQAEADLAETKNEIKAAAKAKTAAEKHAASFEKDKAAAGKKLAAVTSELAEFADKVMTPFQSLREHAPPPLEPEPVPEKADADKTADAPAVDVEAGQQQAPDVGSTA